MEGQANPRKSGTHDAGGGHAWQWTHAVKHYVLEYIGMPDVELFVESIDISDDEAWQDIIIYCNGKPIVSVEATRKKIWPKSFKDKDKEERLSVQLKAAENSAYPHAFLFESKMYMEGFINANETVPKLIESKKISVVIYNSADDKIALNKRLSVWLSDGDLDRAVELVIASVDAAILRHIGGKNLSFKIGDITRELLAKEDRSSAAWYGAKALMTDEDPKCGLGKLLARVGIEQKGRTQPTKTLRAMLPLTAECIRNGSDDRWLDPYGNSAVCDGEILNFPDTPDFGEQLEWCQGFTIPITWVANLAQARLLHVQGGPGSGKTEFLKGLVRCVANMQSGKAQEWVRRFPGMALDGLEGAVYVNGSDLVKARKKRGNRTGIEGTLAMCALGARYGVDPYRTFFLDGFRQGKILICVDALDEASTPAYWRSVLKEGLPAQAKVIVSSRGPESGFHLGLDAFGWRTASLVVPSGDWFRAMIAEGLIDQPTYIDTANMFWEQRLMGAVELGVLRREPTLLNSPFMASLLVSAIRGKKLVGNFSRGAFLQYVCDHCLDRRNEKGIDGDVAAAWHSELVEWAKGTDQAAYNSISTLSLETGDQSDRDVQDILNNCGVLYGDSKKRRGRIYWLNTAIASAFKAKALCSVWAMRSKPPKVEAVKLLLDPSFSDAPSALPPLEYYVWKSTLMDLIAGAGDDKKTLKARRAHLSSVVAMLRAPVADIQVRPDEVLDDISRAYTKLLPGCPENDRRLLMVQWGLAIRDAKWLNLRDSPSDLASSRADSGLWVAVGDGVEVQSHLVTNRAWDDGKVRADVHASLRWNPAYCLPNQPAVGILPGDAAKYVAAYQTANPGYKYSIVHHVLWRSLAKDVPVGAPCDQPRVGCEGNQGPFPVCSFPESNVKRGGADLWDVFGNALELVRNDSKILPSIYLGSSWLYRDHKRHEVETHSRKDQFGFRLVRSMAPLAAPAQRSPKKSLGLREEWGAWMPRSGDFRRAKAFGAVSIYYGVVGREAGAFFPPDPGKVGGGGGHLGEANSSFTAGTKLTDAIAAKFRAVDPALRMPRLAFFAIAHEGAVLKAPDEFDYAVRSGRNLVLRPKREGRAGLPIRSDGAMLFKDTADGTVVAGLARDSLMVLVYGPWGAGLLHCGWKSLLGDDGGKTGNLQTTVKEKSVVGAAFRMARGKEVRYRMIEGVCKDCYGINIETAELIRSGPYYKKCIVDRRVPLAGDARPGFPGLDLAEIVRIQVDALGAILDDEQPTCVGHVVVGGGWEPNEDRYSHAMGHTTVAVPSGKENRNMDANNLYYAFIVNASK